MNWLVATVFSVLSRATYSLGTKTLTNRLPVSSVTQSIFLTGTGTLMGLVLSPLLGGISLHGLGGHWDSVIIMISLVTLGNFIYFRGQSHLDAGTTQIAFSSIVIWGTALSVLFLDSQFSLRQGLGIIVLIAAIIMIQYRKGKRTLSSAVVAIILSAASFAGFQVASAQVSKAVTPATYLLLAYGGPTLLAAAFFAKRFIKEARHLSAGPRRSMVEGTVFAASGSLAYYIFAYFAYRGAPDPGVVVVLLSTQVIASVILGVIFLHERENLVRKGIATVLAFVATLLIKV